jgi:para-aminobenzoate synthetase/4-amino-4-deoxychorismate lyase
VSIDDHCRLQKMPDLIVQIDRGRRWLRLREPARVIDVRDAADLTRALNDVESFAREHGGHAAGFVTYEAGRAFGMRTCTPDPALPLAWFALFEPDHAVEIDEPAAAAPYTVSGLAPSVDQPAFDHAFGRIRHHIGAGDTYQVNYTFDLRGRFAGDPLSLFADLAGTQRGRYSAYINTGTHAICSASPELFFSRANGAIETRPMKGTARRGRTLAEDDDAAARLRATPKERAENVMIVDMMRNDLGRIADTGSVTVPDLLRTERYPTVWQMTSTVSARTSVTLAQIFAALHPSASVTGAPKIRTMEIISELERRPRGVYTGAIGYIAPGGDAQFNVGIRTAVIDLSTNALTFGVGSGIVWDSDPAGEYQECLLKAAIFGRRPLTFDLLETMKWTPTGGYFLLDRHIHRIHRSALYFEFAWNEADVLRELDRAVAGKNEPQRVRLLAARDGGVRVESTPLSRHAAPARLGIANAPIDPADVFLFHKTTHRDVYTRAMRDDCDDVLLWTPHGDVTETTIGNIVVEIGGRKVTPPMDAGLLPGTFREELLERGEIVEGRVTLDDVKAASRIWIINSVREWCPAEVHGRPEGLHYMETTAATAPITTSSATATTAKRSQR